MDEPGYDVIVTIGAGTTLGENVADRAVKGADRPSSLKIRPRGWRMFLLGMHAQQGPVATGIGPGRGASAKCVRRLRHGRNRPARCPGLYSHEA